jgi:hypothetical protein
MKTHEFTLILTRAPTDAKAEKFYEICNDATVAIIAGSAHIHFHREAKSLENALRSALRDVNEAGLAVKRVEMEPDTLTVAT